MSVPSLFPQCAAHGGVGCSEYKREGLEMNGSREEQAALERMRAELVEAENALARASSTAQSLRPRRTTEY